MALPPFPVTVLDLREAFARTRSVLRSADGRAHVRAFAEDPLKLDLPPLIDGSTNVSPTTLRVTAALYLQSELDQAGVVAAAELLVRARDNLAIHDTLARKLEDYATAMRGAGASEWLDAGRRGQLYARLFGVGAAATLTDGAADTNRGFEQLLAALCVALVRIETAFRFSGQPDATRDAAARFAARTLLLNIAARQYGLSSIAAGRLDRQLRASIAILADEELGSMLGVRGVWAVTRLLLGDNAPDAGRHATRGASGQTLFLWLATVLPAIEDERTTLVVVPRDRAVLSAAARWLVASGLTLPQGPVQ